MLCMADEAHGASVRRSKELDLTAKQFDNASQNGASAENIGSHSLLAKDSPNKAPLYQHATNLAIRVATYIAEVMVRQVNRHVVAAARFELDSQKTQGQGKPTNTLSDIPLVDWLHLLQHFLCHPDECEKQWHVEAMKDPGAPTHHVLRYLEKNKALERAKLMRRDHLQTMYKNFGQNVEDDWKVVIDEAKNA
jgi:hypothetical protein